MANPWLYPPWSFHFFIMAFRLSWSNFEKSSPNLALYTWFRMSSRVGKYDLFVSLGHLSLNSDRTYSRSARLISWGYVAPSRTSFFIFCDTAGCIRWAIPDSSPHLCPMDIVCRYWYMIYFFMTSISSLLCKASLNSFNFDALEVRWANIDNAWKLSSLKPYCGKTSYSRTMITAGQFLFLVVWTTNLSVVLFLGPK